MFSHHAVVMRCLYKSILTFFSSPRGSLKLRYGPPMGHDHGRNKRGQEGHIAPGTEKSQKFHKYFHQYSTFASERPHFQTRGRQACFLPRAPSNLVTPLAMAHRLKNTGLSTITTLQNFPIRFPCSGVKI